MTFILIFLLMGWLGSFLAGKLGRNQALWFLIVGLTGGFGLIVMLILHVSDKARNIEF